MHFAHHNRQERREQQRDVSEQQFSTVVTSADVISSYLFLSLHTGGFGSVFPADARPNPHNCFRSQPVDGHAASLQP